MRIWILQEHRSVFLYFSTIPNNAVHLDQERELICSEVNVYRCYRESLNRAKENDCHSIGFPLISAGIFGYPKDKAWRKALQSCNDWINKNPNYNMDIVFAVLDQRIYDLGKQTMHDLGINRNNEPKDDGNFVFFWKLGQENEEFSNWYPREFAIEGIKYNCVEQYMMAKKALLFNDLDIYQKIMASTDPGECKDLGKLVCNFNSAVWDSCKYEIVYDANYAKFHQNPDLMAKLTATGDAVMAEASPQDKIWGIGMEADDLDARDPQKWKGENLLGKILMEIREHNKDAIKYYSRSLDDSSHLYKHDISSGKFYYMDHCWTGEGIWYEREGGFPPEFDIVEITADRAREISNNNLGGIERKNS